MQTKTIPAKRIRIQIREVLPSADLASYFWFFSTQALVPMLCTIYRQGNRIYDSSAAYTDLQCHSPASGQD